MNRIIEAKNELETARYHYQDGKALLDNAYHSPRECCQASFLYSSVAKHMVKAQEIIHEYLIAHTMRNDFYENHRSLYNAYIGLSPKIVEFEEVALDFDIEVAKKIDTEALDYAIGILSKVELDGYRISVA